MAAPAPMLEGSVIAQKYRLERLVGEGGMGSVWRAFNLQLEAPVAIKLLRSDLAGAALCERLRVEARASAQLIHPSIVRVFDVGEAESGDPFIVMELLTGESLGTRLERGAVRAIEALQLLLPIAEALSFAHSRGVVHRDLKPDNIFLASEGGGLQPKLLDFGIAKLMSSGPPSVRPLSQAGTLVGSPEYMSPEQAYGRSDLDQRSDVWAFCVVLYETLTGHAPFSGDNNAGVLRKVVDHEPVPLEFFANCDSELGALIHWGLNKDREARPASVFELGRKLAVWLMSQGVRQDATGSSLEAKWCAPARAFAAPAAIAARGVTAPAPPPLARHEHATLASVVNRSPLPSEEPLELSPRRETKWLPLSAAIMVIVGCLGVAATQWRSAESGEPAPLTIAAAAPTASPPAVVVVEAKPVEPLSAIATSAPAPSITPRPRLPAASALVARPPAWPSGKAPRKHRSDLIDPYTDGS